MRKRKSSSGVSSEVLRRRLNKSAIYAHLGAVTNNAGIPSRIEGFLGNRHSSYALLNQVYSNARMDDLFPGSYSFMDGSPSEYPWPSDLFGPVDEN
jgi:hypothetical protein